LVVGQVEVEVGVLRLLMRRINQDECTAVRPRPAPPSPAKPAQFACYGKLFGHLRVSTNHSWNSLPADLPAELLRQSF